MNNQIISSSEFFEIAPIGIITFDSQWKITSANNNVLQFGVINPNKFPSLIGTDIYKNNIFNSIDLRNDFDKLSRGILFEKELNSQNKLYGGEINLVIKSSPVMKDEKFAGGILILEDLRISMDLQKSKIVGSDYFRKILSQLADYYFITDTEGNVKYTPKPDDPQNFEFLFNKIDKNIEQLFGKGRPQLFKKIFNEIKNSGKGTFTSLSASKAGNIVYFSANFIPIFSDENEIQFIIVLLKDDTGNVNLKTNYETEIQQLTEYINITSKIVDSVLSFDPSGKIIFWNEAASELFGYQKSEIFGKDISKVIPALDETFQSEMKSELIDHDMWSGKFSFDLSGQKKTIGAKARFVYKDNEPNIVLLCNDITDIEAEQKSVKTAEETYRSMIESIEQLVCNIDSEGMITYCNPYFIDLFPISIDDFSKRNILDFIDPEYLSKENITLEGLISGNIKEIKLLKKNGEEIDASVSVSELEPSKNDVMFYTLLFSDLTDMKVEESDFQLLKSVFESSHEGIAVIENNKIILANKFLATQLGFDDPNDIIGRQYFDFVGDEDTPAVKKHMDSLFNNEIPIPAFEISIVKRTGEEISLENSFSIYESSGKKYITVFLRDISEVKEAQRSTEESEERFRSITANINEFLWTAERIEGKLKVVFYTEAVKKTTGYSNEEFIDNQKLWYKIIHPNDLEDAISNLKRLYHDPATKNGEVEYRILTKSGMIKWIRNRINIVREGDGKIQIIYGSVRDITNDKRAEEKLKESTENLKMLNETKDRFISIISHDLRTPFSSILGFTDLLLSEPEMEVDKRVQYVNFIQESSKSMLSLVNSLLDWTRLQTGRISFEPQRINASYIVSNTLQMLSGSAMQKNIELISEIKGDVYVHADENLLMQVFSNLVSNATKFTNPGGHIIVYAEPTEEHNKVKFRVMDNGIGIKEEDIDKLFTVDTKYTTNGTQGEKGSGLGLSLCAEIVQKHGGEIWVESHYGEGSEFIFTIPVSSTNILLVDDVLADRLLYKKLLKSIIPNYQVLEAENGKEALDLIKQSVPALIITDHVMPVMTGTELVQQLNMSESKQRPPVIVLSGDINRVVEESYGELGVEFIFSKPVNLAKFKQAVDKSLKQAIFN